MQWKWNAWLHIPHATVHSSDVAEAWLAWHSMHKSMMWFRQMAQLSTTMSQAHRATAFHFLTSNLWLKKHMTDEFSNCTNNLEVKLNLKVAHFPLKFEKLRKTHFWSNSRGILRSGFFSTFLRKLSCEKNQFLLSAQKLKAIFVQKLKVRAAFIYFRV